MLIKSCSLINVHVGFLNVAMSCLSLTAFPLSIKLNNDMGVKRFATATTNYIDVIIPRPFFWDWFYIKYASAFNVDYGSRLSVNCCHDCR